jgi:hypothetical protein
MSASEVQKAFLPLRPNPSYKTHSTEVGEENSLVGLTAERPFNSQIGTGAEVVSNWIDAKKIKILNVAGPRASKDPRIYDATRRLLTLVIQNLFPKTVDEAVNILMAEMPLKDKAKIAKTEEEDLSGLHMFLGGYIRRAFGLWSGNCALLKSCAKAAGKKKIHPDDASSIIINELWNRLKTTHAMRAIKP